MQLRAPWAPRRCTSTVPSGASPVAERSSSPAEFGAVSDATDSRVFECGWCNVEVAICRRCDRGHRYCGPKCSKAARRASVRRAGDAYQKTERGRANHAARQQQYDEREATKLTHQGPPVEEEVCVMELSLAEVAPKPPSDEAETQDDAQPTARQQPDLEPDVHDEATGFRPEGLVRCAICGCWCHFHGRRSPVRRRGSGSGLRRPPRLPRAMGSRPPPV